MCKNKETKQYNSNWASGLVHESVESSMVNETQDQIFFRDRGLRNANKSLYPYKKNTI